MNPTPIPAFIRWRQLWLALALLVAVATSCVTHKRCPVKGCHVRMIHKHNGQAYRGVAWWRRNKNPKVGQDLHPPARYPGSKEVANENRKRQKSGGKAYGEGKSSSPRKKKATSTDAAPAEGQKSGDGF